MPGVLSAQPGVATAGVLPACAGCCTTRARSPEPPLGLARGSGDEGDEGSNRTLQGARVRSRGPAGLAPALAVLGQPPLSLPLPPAVLSEHLCTLVPAVCC